MTTPKCDAITVSGYRTQQERIEWIAERMAEGDWPVDRRGVYRTRKLLAKMWDVPETSVREYIAAAAAILQMSPADRESLQDKLAQTFAGIAEEARRSVNHTTGLPDYGAMLKAYELYAKFSGVQFENKVNVSGSVSLEDVDELRKRLNEG